MLKAVIYLLTSMRFPCEPHSALEEQLFAAVESSFLSYFSETTSNVQIIVKHRVKAGELAEILQKEDTLGVFYLSHGAHKGFATAISDYENQDVQSLFQLSETLKVLGIFCCHADKMTDSFDPLTDRGCTVLHTTGVCDLIDIQPDYIKLQPEWHRMAADFAEATKGALRTPALRLPNYNAELLLTAEGHQEESCYLTAKIGGQIRYCRELEAGEIRSDFIKFNAEQSGGLVLIQTMDKMVTPKVELSSTQVEVKHLFRGSSSKQYRYVTK